MTGGDGVSAKEAAWYRAAPPRHRLLSQQNYYYDTRTKSRRSSKNVKVSNQKVRGKMQRKEIQRKTDINPYDYLIT